MTPEKIQQIVARYRQRFSHIRGERALGQWAPEQGEPIKHAIWMLEQMAAFGPEDHEKAQRWLGFVQGVLWTQAKFSIDQMRAHNKADA